MKLIWTLSVSMVAVLVFNSTPARAYIPIVSELVILRAVSTGLEQARKSREEDYRRRQFTRNNAYQPTEGPTNHPGIEGIVVLSDNLTAYLGTDLNQAAKHLLTCVVDVAEVDDKESEAAVNRFLARPAVVEFFKALANPRVDFTPLASELPFFEALSIMGIPNDVIRAQMNAALRRTNMSLRELQTAALSGALNGTFLQGFANNPETKAAIKDMALTFAAWSQISPRAMIIKGFSPDEQTNNEREKAEQKLERSAKFLQAMLMVYTQFLPEARRERMAKVLLDAQEQKLSYTDTIVTVLKQVGPVVLKRLQEGDVAVAELQEALRIFYENVPPMDWEQVESIILADYHLSSIEEGFVEFDKTPLATGTVAQVHRAKIKVDGKIVDVAVKVWRPGFDEAVSEDLAVLKRGQSTIEQYINPRVFAEYIKNTSKSLRGEGDPELESENIMNGRKVYHRPNEGISSLELVPFPGSGRAHTRYTLITKFVDGTSLAKASRDSAPAVFGSLKALSTAYTHWLKVLLDTDNFAIPGFMHGDLHPGNLKVAGQQVYFLDFGSVSTLSPSQRQGMRRFLEGYLAKDPTKFFEGIDIILGPNTVKAWLRERLLQSLSTEFRMDSPMSEIIELVSNKLVENELPLFGALTQIKRVVAQVENELRSLKASYEAMSDDSAGVSAIQDFSPAAIYQTVLNSSSKNEACAAALSPQKKKRQRGGH